MVNWGLDMNENYLLHEVQEIYHICNKLLCGETKPPSKGGLCYLIFQIKSSDDLMKNFYNQWEHFSGNYGYPISVFDDISPSQQYKNALKLDMIWNKTTRYGRMRWKLLEEFTNYVKNIIKLNGYDYGKI